MVVFCPVTGAEYTVASIAIPLPYEVYRCAAIQIVAAEHGANECYTALRALREASSTSLSAHVETFKSYVKIYKVLTNAPLAGPMLATLFEESLAPSTYAEMDTYRPC